MIRFTVTLYKTSTLISDVNEIHSFYLSTRIQLVKLREITCDSEKTNSSLRCIPTVEVEYVLKVEQGGGTGQGV